MKFTNESRRKQLFPNVSDADWNDWHWQVANRAETLEDLKKYIELTPEEEEGVKACLGTLRMAITPYYLSLIDPNDPHDPVRKQAIPTAKELHQSCADLLEGFGGHELAAGFTISEENIDAFRARMNRYVRSASGGERAVSCLDVDAPISCPGEVTLAEVEQLDQLEPYGAGNPRPVFALLGATVDSVQPVGQGKHLKLRLSKGTCRFDAIFFSATAEECGVAPGTRVDAAFYLQANTFRGTTTLQLQLVDLRPSLTPSRHEAESLDLLHRLTGEQPLTAQEKKDWIATQTGVTVGSDAFFPFGDNVERARKSGVQYIAQPGGSIRDDQVIATANKYGMVMAFTGIRLFHH